MFAVQDFAEAAHRVSQGHIATLNTSELFGNEERLGEEALYFTGACHDELVIFAQLIDAQDSDNVLQVFIALQYTLHFAGSAVMLFAHHVRIQNARSGSQRVHRRVDALVGNSPPWSAR